MKKIALIITIIFLTSCTSAEIKQKQERKIKTFVGLKEENAVMQKYDFSCGISSLLTLFKYHFGDDSFEEKEMLSDFIESLPKEKQKEVIEKGLSVLDLKNLSESLGYKVYAVKLKKEMILKIDRPILVYLETRDYKHFSVLRGVKNGTVFLADPSTGKTRMSIPVFLKIWKGNIAIFLDAPRSGVSKLNILEEELVKPEIILLQNIL